MGGRKGKIQMTAVRQASGASHPLGHHHKELQEGGLWWANELAECLSIWENG